MYPEKLKTEQSKKYWSEQDFFSDKPFDFIHAYLHDDYRYGLHSHQFCEINVIVRGSGRHFIGESSLPVEVGDVFVIPPEIPHGYYSENRIDVFHILIGSKFFVRYKAELEQAKGFNVLFDAEPFLRRVSESKSNLRLNATEFIGAKSDFELILDAQKKGAYALRSALTLSFILKLSNILNERLSSGRHGIDTVEMLRVMSYINDNLDRKLTSEALADFMCVSIATLNRRFLSSIGVSPLKYVASCRVKKAESLIKEGNYTRTEIAQICGFFDVSHMNKFLKMTDRA